ncbi:hypothetical protein GLOIN_2v1775927 [Rhizophagus irregularis DAOM 181602=DAOM 197198]|nr:hypothetical protein GLOIN_2v1775927 [Rhizophagus irregularis DAOM 181602=DAOM 197198]
MAGTMAGDSKKCRKKNKWKNTVADHGTVAGKPAPRRGDVGTARPLRPRSAGGLPSSEERKTKIRFGQLPGSEERKRTKIRFGRLPGSEERKRTKIRSGGLRTNGRTKIRSGGLPKNGKTQRFVRVGFPRTENPKIRSGGLPKNGKPKESVSILSALGLGYADMA